MKSKKPEQDAFGHGVYDFYRANSSMKLLSGTMATLKPRVVRGLIFRQVAATSLLRDYGGEQPYPG
jgi:hypothetical protein